MINRNKLINSAVAAFLVLATSQSAFSATADTTASTEKCYGVAKAGSNDCSTATSSCAGSSTKDNQADAFLLIPTGLCDKLVGGHIKPDTKSSS